MRLLSLLPITLVVFLSFSCGDTQTTGPTTQSTNGEVYGSVRLFNCYGSPESDFSGITVQLLDNTTLLQSVQTNTQGLYSFPNVDVGVYTIRLFKEGYVWREGLKDTTETDNIQFVGKGRFRVDGLLRNSPDYSLLSKAIPDSTYWAIKPTLRYDLSKQIDTTLVWIRDSVLTIDGHGTFTKSIYGRGTRERSKLILFVDFEKSLPSDQMTRQISFSFKPKGTWSYSGLRTSVEGSATTFRYEMDLPNTVLRDSLGKVVKQSDNIHTYSNIVAENLLIRASSEIPNSIMESNKPKRIAQSNELFIELDK